MRQISPNQPFQVRHQGPLSTREQEGLVNFYQPLVGSDSLALYLALIHQPQERLYWSQRSIHAQLLSTLNMGIDQVDKARVKLEGVGLLRTYREVDTHPDFDQQTLLYDVSLPLTGQEFLSHSLLSTALMSQIGDQNYHQLVQEWEVSLLDKKKYTEITQSFEQVFTYSIAKEEVQSLPSLRGERQPVPTTGEESFNYGNFLRYIMAEGISHHQLNQALKQEVLALHSVYDLNEMDATEIVKMSINNTTGQIQLDQLKEIAQRRQHFRQKRSEAHQESQETAADTAFPAIYDRQQLKERKEKIQARYEELSSSEIDLILVTEQIPNEDFLMQIQERRDGFATDQERYFVRDLKTKTQLDLPVINYLIYHLLIEREQESIFKGSLERTANQWQQAKIQTVAQAILYVKEETVRRQKQAEARQQRSGYSRAKHQEVQPEWFQSTAESASQEDTDSAVDSLELQRRVQRLYEEGDDD